MRSEEEDGEDGGRLAEMTVFLKSGEAVTVVNYEPEMRAAAEILLPLDSEYDGGDVAIEITGVRLFPDPSPITLMVQPWNVSAVTLVTVTSGILKAVAARLAGEGDERGTQ